jgi:hypothetical protein
LARRQVGFSSRSVLWMQRSLGPQGTIPWLLGMVEKWGVSDTMIEMSEKWMGAEIDLAYMLFQGMIWYAHSQIQCGLSNCQGQEVLLPSFPTRKHPLICASWSAATCVHRLRFASGVERGWEDTLSCLAEFDKHCRRVGIDAQTVRHGIGKASVLAKARLPPVLVSQALMTCKCSWPTMQTILLLASLAGVG